MMNNTQKVLDAWILIEQLSEGAPPNQYLPLLGAQYTYPWENCYQTLQQTLQKPYNRKKGLALYFDIFDFQTVIDILKNALRIEEPLDDEIPIGQKFSLVLFFDEVFRLYQDHTFVSTSYYIKAHHNETIDTLLNQDAFFKFEQSMKDKVNELFRIKHKEENHDPSETHGHDRAEPQDEAKAFNDAIQDLMTFYDFKTVHYTTIRHPNDHSLLHSFFIRDLQKAKRSQYPNLLRYLRAQAHPQRIHLDSTQNPDAIETLLQPKHYPLGRFPSSPRYALSLMQQVAVNVATQSDASLLSVNGPPGTGKTTLLRDIFAHHIVEQAFQICQLDQKRLKHPIGLSHLPATLPTSISQHGIVVTSSNNSALQNIVNECPLQQSIDSDLLTPLMQADYFCDIANQQDEALQDKPSPPTSAKQWGLFSREGGNSQNLIKLKTLLDEVCEVLNTPLGTPATQIYQAFLDQYRKLKDQQMRYQKAYEDYKKHGDTLAQREAVQQEQETLNAQYQKQYTEQQKLQAKIDEIDANRNKLRQNKRPHWLKRLISASLREQDAEQQNYIATYEQQLYKKIAEKHNLDFSLEALEKQLNRLQERLQNMDTMATLRPLDMSQDYPRLQQDNPWFTQAFRLAQSQLFIAALKVRKAFLHDNKSHVDTAVQIWKEKYAYVDAGDALKTAWEWVNLMIPVISTTFASFSSMFRGMPEGAIANVFIDEAGQANPQYSVGAICASRRLLAVGDPAQIEPVSTLNVRVMRLLAKHLGIDFERYLPPKASTQTLIDASSQYGFYKPDPQAEQGQWIGIPLWVHRRCAHPMFDLSNAISYNNCMVQANPNVGRMAWIDIRGKAINKYVEAQGDYLYKTLKSQGTATDNIYVISPFLNVVKQLREKLKAIAFPPERIGTIHTFQGKEADIVYLVLGADEQSKGAANWAVNNDNPNMMNVAATRAKKAFYIIGDKALYQSLHSRIIDTTLDIIAKQAKPSERQ